MPKCPQCQTELKPLDLAASRCGACGRALGHATVSQFGDVGATVQFEPGAIPNSEPASEPTPETPPKPTGTVANVRVDQTLDFGAGVALPAAETPEPKKPATVPDVQIAQTMDLGAAPALPAAESFAPPPGHGTVPDRQLMQTMDSTPLPDRPIVEDPPAGGSSSFHERQLAKTYDSDEVSSDFGRRLSGIWGDEPPPGISPRMTIKGAQRGEGRADQTLVIRPRTLREVKAPAQVSADYELLNVLGEGGMGVVYSARQASIDRTVAIKMLKPNMAADDEQRRKFLSEAVVTGDLDHPNIVPMYDLGSNESGALFYAMKKVQGTPWSNVIHNKTQGENIEILLKVADAVAFAHSRGVVHRDLKPENVMLGDYGEVLVMDWGLAYSTPEFRKSSSITQTHSMGGTPAYMAPEMALGPIDRITYLSDVYLLGAILYEIVTGRPPHTGPNVTRCLHAAARNDIIPTDKTGELVEVARRALATKPEERYPSVVEFQAAIRQYLAHSESIALSARAEDDLAEAERTDDYQAYSRALFGFEEAISLWDANQRARDSLSAARLAYAACALRKGDFDLGLTLLQANEPKHAELRAQIVAAQRERDARQQRLKNAKRMAAGLVAAVVVVITVAFFSIRAQRDRARLAEEQTRTERDRAIVAEGQAKKDRDLAQQAKDAEVYQAYIARIGLAAAKIEENAFDGAVTLLDQCPPELRNWEWGRLRFLCGQSLASFDARAPIGAVAYDAAHRRAASGGWDGKVRLWNVDTGELLREFPDGGKFVHALAFSPDGTRLATGGSDDAGYAKVWNLATGRVETVLKGHGDAVLCVAYSRRGDRLLTSSFDGTARLYDAASGSELCNLHGHTWWVWSAAFADDDRQVVTASQDGTAIVWSIDEELRKRTGSASPAEGPRKFTRHAGAIHAVAVTPGGAQIATAGHDGRVLLWNLADIRPFSLQEVFAENPPPPQPCVELKGHSAAVRCLAFSPDGSRLVSGGLDNTICVWDVPAGKLIKTLRGHAGQVRGCRFLNDGRLVLSGSHDAQVKVWDIDKYEETRVLDQRALRGHADAVLAAAFSPDGESIVTASRDQTAKTWNTRTGRELRTFEEGHKFLATAAAFFPDGKTALTSAVDGTTRLWNVERGTQVAKLDDTGRSAAVALSADGKLILTGALHNRARLWDASGKLLRELSEHRSEVTAAAISPNGDLLFTGETSGRCNLWKAATGEPVWSRLSHSRKITAAAFTADGKTLLSASVDHTVGQWDAATGRELTDRTLKHPSGVTSLALVAGSRAVTACDDGQVRLWNLATGQLAGVIDLPEGAQSHVAASRDGRWVLVISSEQRTVRLWEVGAAREVTPPKSAAPKAAFIDLKPGGGLLWAAEFSPDGKSIMTVGGGEARLWDAVSGEQLQTFSAHAAVAGVAFSPDGRRIATGSWDNSAKIWNAETGLAERKLTGRHTGHINSVAFSSDGRLVLTASDDGTAGLWDAQTGESIRSFTGHAARVTHAAFSPDDMRIITSSADKTARIWNAANGRELQALEGHAWDVLWAEFSRDGRRIVTGSADNRAKIWDAATGQELHTLAGHTSGVTSAAFSPDGSRALTAGQDSAVKLWDTLSGKEILSLKGHTQEVTSVSFSRDGRYALSSSRDGAAFVWLALDWKPVAVEEPKPRP